MKNLILTALIAIVASVLTVQLMPKQAADGVVKHKETAYERVMRTGTLRCGYVPYGVANILDPNTNEQSGIVYDIVNRIGEILKLDVEWVAESTWGTSVSDLETNRYDALCAAAWLMPDVVGKAEYSDPLYYVNLGTWVRPDENRFNNNFSRINSEDVKIAAIDGSMPDMIAKYDFPNAKVTSLPNNSDYALQLLNVATGKADVAFIEYAIAKEYLAKNPGTLKDITYDGPIRSMENVIALPKGELELLQTINDALRSLRSAGEIDKIISKYEKYPDSFARVAKGYSE